MLTEKLREQEHERTKKVQALFNVIIGINNIVTLNLAQAKRSSKSFNSKEKVKRSRGQASREKSVVEEEKRLLRNMPGGGGYGLD